MSTLTNGTRLARVVTIHPVTSARGGALDTRLSARDGDDAPHCELELRGDFVAVTLGANAPFFVPLSNVAELEPAEVR